MLHPNNYHEYQRKAIIHQLQYTDSMLWLGMGLGKTSVTLGTIEHRMRAGQVQKTLIFGPLRVIHAVWEREARKWSHTDHLRFSVMHGTEKQRLRQLFTEADIYLCNYENMAWLAGVLDHYYLSQDKPLPFQMVVYDEVSKVKNASSVRMDGGWVTHEEFFLRKPNEPTVKELKAKFKSREDFKEAKKLSIHRNEREYQVLKDQGRRDSTINKLGDLVVTPEKKERIIGWKKIIEHIPFRTGLTGTPASNGYLDLFGQYLAIDNGERLGKFITHYKDSYFTKGYDGWTYEPTALGQQWIEHKISDITLKMDAEDYLEIPEMVINDVMIDLPEKVMQQYREVEKDMFTALDDGTEIELFSQVSVSNKCLQFCNGTPYVSPESREYVNLHDAKLQALESIIEEAAGSPVLCSYSFKSDAERIMKKFKKLKPVNMTEVKGKDVPKVIKQWSSGRIKLMIGHPASMGHGVDGLQDNGNILVWFGLNWSLELYEQMIARLKRQGQVKHVILHRLLCPGTIDVAVADALRRKEEGQTGLKAAIQRYRDGLTPKDGAMSFL